MNNYSLDFWNKFSETYGTIQLQFDEFEQKRGLGFCVFCCTLVATVWQGIDVVILFQDHHKSGSV